MAGEGLSETLSHWFEHYGGPFEDRALARIQYLVDNPKVGESLINCQWSLVRTGDRGDMFMLSDRPLVRVHGHDHPRAAWYLPLNPSTVFCAAKNGTTLLDAPLHRLARRLNVVSAEQAQQFMFCIENPLERGSASTCRGSRSARGAMGEPRVAPSTATPPFRYHGERSVWTTPKGFQRAAHSKFPEAASRSVWLVNGISRKRPFLYATNHGGTLSSNAGNLNP